VVLPVVLGFTAAFLFAASAALQRRAVLHAAHSDPARKAATHRLPVLWLFRRLLRQRVWLLGWITNLCGFCSQAAALHFGSVALVQPLLVTQLLFALPMASAAVRQWPSLRDWLSAGAISGGVALFLSAERAAPLEGAADRSRLLLAVGVAAVTVIALLQLAQRRGTVGLQCADRRVGGHLLRDECSHDQGDDGQLLTRGVAATALDWPAT
jgi:hypothetical protein